MENQFKGIGGGGKGANPEQVKAREGLGVSPGWFGEHAELRTSIMYIST